MKEGFTYSFSDLLSELESPSVTELRKVCAELHKEGMALFDLSMINPDFTPGREILDRFIEASLKAGSHRYTAARGVLKLRSAFAEKYRTAFGVNSLDQNKQICITLGAKDATQGVLSVLSKETDQLLLPSPTYPGLRSAAILVGGFQVSFYPVGEEKETVASICELLQSKPGALLVLNNPNNPTGDSLSVEALRKIIGVAAKTESFVFNDFVYGEMHFQGENGETKPSSILSVAEAPYSKLIEVYSLSKAYAIPGWRVAGLIGDPEIVQLIARRKSHVDYGTFVPLQIGAAAGLRADPGFLHENFSRISKRAEVVASGLSELGFEVIPPRAGASVWAKLPNDYPASASEFAEKLVRDTGVVVLPGEVFGPQFSSFLRIALVQPRTVLLECVRRIEKLIEKEREGANSEKSHVVPQGVVH